MVVLPWEQQKDALRILVVGDLILDEYLEGEVSRISPEAPVPVHMVTRNTVTAGGAANVALNIQQAGGAAAVAGVLGDDEAASQLRGILTSAGITTDGVLTDAGRPTVRKTRITSNNQQLVRVDWEKVSPPEERLVGKLEESILALEADALLLSDYGKGCLTAGLMQNLIEAGGRKGIPVVIDPKGHDYSRYKGATLVTPNRKEACEALDLDPATDIAPAELAGRIRRQFSIEHVLVTLGSQGMFLLSGSGDGLHLPADAREVYDVSGAGDTVVALMTLGLACGTAPAEAMRIANAGAGLVVEKFGTRPVQLEELREAVTPGRLGRGRTADRKIIDAARLQQLLRPGKERQEKVVFTNGCFDILHAGHAAYLENAAARGDLLVVGINADASVRRLKGRGRPVVPELQRMQLIAALECVDYVVPFSEDTPAELIAMLLPDVLVKGADYGIDEIVGAEEVRKAGGEVFRIPFVEGLSTSKIIDRIRDLQS